MSRKKARRREGVAQRELYEPVTQALTRRWVHWLVPALIALVTFAAFLPTLHNQFVNWDDVENFVDNPHYRGLGWTQLRWMWTTHLGHYIPLTWMTLGLDYVLWGMNPVGYHLMSLLLHAANAVVFFFIARRLLTLALPSPSERGHALAVAAGFAALVFAIHPLRVESVAWVTERRDVLSGLFYLSAILIYLWACEGGARGRGWYWLSVAVFGCALLSKSMVVNLPVVLLILDVYPLRRLGGFVGWWSEPARRIYVEKIPFVLLAAAASAVAVMAQLSKSAMIPVAHLSALGRLAVSAYGLSFYLWKMVVPLNLSPLYMRPPTVDPEAPPFILSYGLVLAITAIVLALRRRIPGLPAAWAAYVVVLLPVLGIFQSGSQIAADRYTYLAGLGWAILAGAGLLACRHATRFLIRGSAVGVLVGLGVLTWNQVLPINPDSADAHNNWGTALAQQGKLVEAIEHYQRALQMRPDYADAHTNLGNALAQQGKLSEAVEHYGQALKIKPDFGKAVSNLGSALARQGKLIEASDQFRRALEIMPDNADVHYNLGMALARQGKPAEASEHFQAAVRINPNDADAHYNWGNALARQRKPAEAIAHYQQALRIKPDSADAYTNWGNVLAQQGKLAEAVEHYQQALKLRQSPEAQSNLVDTLRRLGTGKPDAAPSLKAKKAE